MEEREHTQFATVSERLSTLCTLVRLLAPVTSFMSVQGGLSGEYLAADGAFEVFIFTRLVQTQSKNQGGDEQLL